MDLGCQSGDQVGSFNENNKGKVRWVLVMNILKGKK
jgi:hypothetical protein